MDPERMRKDWNRRANENAMHYIMTGRADWDYEDFMATGEADVKRFVDPFLERYGVARLGSILELGCGIGRMTLALAARFDRVDAFDVSDEMIERARTLHKDKSNIRFQVCNGRDLKSCPSLAYDMVFSYIVLQHIPDPEIIYNYCREFGRLLKSNGVFLFQVANNSLVGHELYVRRWEERRRALQIEKKAIPFEDYAHAYLASKIESYETIIQTPVELDRSIEVLAEAGLRVDVVTGQGTDLMWLGGRKVR